MACLAASDIPPPPPPWLLFPPAPWPVEFGAPDPAIWLTFVETIGSHGFLTAIQYQ
jgi:hypothetical protein